MNLHIYNQGQVLENEMFSKLKVLPIKALYTERDLIKEYGFNASSVDFLVEFENFDIFIQTKYLKSRRRESSHIKRFLNSIQVIKSDMQNKCFYGIWVSRCKPFDDNITYLKSNNVAVISCYESIPELVNQTIKHIETNQMF